MPVKKIGPLEKQYGKPMPAILADLYTQLGDHKEVANRLGITMKTLWQWRKELGCETVVRLSCLPGKEEAESVIDVPVRIG